MGIPDVLFGPARGADCASAVRAAQGYEQNRRPSSGLSPPAPNESPSRPLLGPIRFNIRH